VVMTIGLSYRGKQCIVAFLIIEGHSRWLSYGLHRLVTEEAVKKYMRGDICQLVDGSFLGGGRAISHY